MPFAEMRNECLFTNLPCLQVPLEVKKKIENRLERSGRTARCTATKVNMASETLKVSERTDRDASQ